MMMHPGFGAVAEQIAQRLRKARRGMSLETARRHARSILAAAGRGASRAAKRINPRLLRIRRRRS
jgi:hypothetical protein